MKKISFLFIFALAVGLSGCTDLDTKLTNEWSEEDTWQIAEKAHGVLLSVYKELMPSVDAWDGCFLDVATDNATTRLTGSSIYMLAHGGMTAAQNPIDVWTHTYDQLQKIHLFLDRGLADEVRYNLSNDGDDASIKKRLRGEALMLRAWCGFRLLQTYGGKTADGEALGYPIVTSYVDASQAANTGQFIRNSYEECVNQICKDCDEAMSLLPLVYKGSDAIIGQEMVGRASGLAAAALKSRVLLYAASPAYQPDNVVKITGVGQFNVTNPSVYKAKWERAAEWAAKVVEMDGMGTYAALQPKELCDGGDNQSAELLLRTFMGRNHYIEQRHYPPFYHGNAQTVPTQNLADAFPALNGYPITDSRSGYDASHPYAVERDKRFDVNLYYQGRQFGVNKSTIDVAEGGKDSPFFSPKASPTGYYLAKFVNTGLADMLSPLNTQDSRHYNPLLRKGEVWLNMAEAANEAWGPTTVIPGTSYSARDIIKTIREVSGGITDTGYLDEQSASQEGMRLLIQNERRLELAFENHRYWDMRRWLLPLGQTIKAMRVSRDSQGVESFHVESIEDRSVLNSLKYYYAPLPYDEMRKNPSLKNNLGW